jgi:hypothetical protein
MQEGEVLLKSLCVNNPDIPVYVISRNGEADSLVKYSVVKKVHNEPLCDWGENREFRSVRTSRFRYAKELGEQGVTVTLILDADMVSLRPMHQIFRMAESGTILVSCNNTINRYRQKHFLDMNIEMPENTNKIFGSFCTVPMFINPTIHKDFLEKVWNSPTGNDLDVLNLYIMQMGLEDSIYYLPSWGWTGIHHSCLKPETFVIKTDQGLFSKTGEPIYMMHGHWNDINYHGVSEKGVDPNSQMLEPMIKNYGYHKPYVECAKECIRILKEEYDKYAKMWSTTHD